MQSVQESKQELEASIRYAENAISSAKATIESMEFRQEMAKKQYAEQTGREQALEEKVAQLERDLTVKTAQAEAWKKEARELKEGAPTMPVIPKAVAIAIFREGLAYGVEAACTELDNAADLCIEETEYCGGFEVSFSKYIDLSDHLDTDWMRDKCGDCSEKTAIDALKTLCVDNEFECRIHGIDDNENKNENE